MRLPTYTTYKKAGDAWLGKVPKHWEIKRLKYLASVNDEALPETTPPEFELTYVDIGNVKSAEGIIADEQLTFDTAPSRARRIVRDGDTIVSTVRTYLRAIAPIRKPPKNLIVSTGFAVVRPDKVQAPFLSYALRESSFVETVVARSVGVSYPAINASDVGTIAIPLPEPGEQRAIADFLDRETARLDKLVGKKRELIGKLKEKRAALISRTVTRGLPPDAARAAGLNPHPKLKPSGIEWLGDIPEHWEGKRIKRVAEIRYGLGEPPEYVDDGIPFIRATDIKRGKIEMEFVRKVDRSDVPWSRRPELCDEEILVVRSGAYTGDSAIVTHEIVGCIAGYDMVLTVTKASARFVAWVLLAKYMLQGQIHLSRLRAAQPHSECRGTW